MAKTPRYVAYSNLANHKSGAEVNPDDFGGVDSEDFRYMLEHRTIVPRGDPDAPAPPDDDEEAAPATASTDSGPVDQTVRQPGQAPAEMTSSGAVSKPTSGSSPAGPSAAAAKPTGSSAS